MKPSRESKIEARKRGAASRQVSASQPVLGSPRTPKVVPQRRKSKSRATTPRRQVLEDDPFQSNSRESTPGSVTKTPRSLGMLFGAFNDGTVTNTKRHSRTPRSPYIPSAASSRTPLRKTPIAEKENISPVEMSPPIHKMTRSPGLSKTVAQFKEALKRRPQKRKEPSFTTSEVVPVPKRRKPSMKGLQTLAKQKRTAQRNATSGVRNAHNVSDSDDMDFEDENKKISIRTESSKNKNKKTKMNSAKTTKANAKMIEVKLQRLSYSPTDTSSSKNVSSLDVLAQIMSEFLSASQPTKSSYIDKRAIRSHSTLIEDHFSRLIDHTLNNEALSKELLRSNKQKEELRNKIYDVKKKHDELAVKLERTRNSYRMRKARYEANMKIRNSFSEIQGDETTNIELTIKGKQNMLIDTVKLQMAQLDKTINPETGLLTKLEGLNEKLIKLDEPTKN